MRVGHLVRQDMKAGNGHLEAGIEYVEVFPERGDILAMRTLGKKDATWDGRRGSGEYGTGLTGRQDQSPILVKASALHKLGIELPAQAAAQA